MFKSVIFHRFHSINGKIEFSTKYLHVPTFMSQLNVIEKQTSHKYSQCQRMQQRQCVSAAIVCLKCVKFRKQKSKIMLCVRYQKSHCSVYKNGVYLIHSAHFNFYFKMIVFFSCDWKWIKLSSVHFSWPKGIYL